MNHVTNDIIKLLDENNRINTRIHETRNKVAQMMYMEVRWNENMKSQVRKPTSAQNILEQKDSK